jgi:hypothetical protein
MKRILDWRIADCSAFWEILDGLKYVPYCLPKFRYTPALL